MNTFTSQQTLEVTGLGDRYVNNGLTASFIKNCLYASDHCDCKGTVYKEQLIVDNKNSSGQ